MIRHLFQSLKGGSGYYKGKILLLWMGELIPCQQSCLLQPFQDTALCHIILIVGINEHDASSFDRIDDGLCDGLRQGRTSEASSQSTRRSRHGRVGISCSMYHDCPLTGFVVDALLQSVQYQRITVFPLIRMSGEIESERTFV